MSKPLYLALFGLSALLSSTMSTAEEATWFEVELAVFERPQVTSERFPEELTPLKLSSVRDLLGPAVMPDTSALELALSDCQNFGWQPDQPECQPDTGESEPLSDLPPRITAIKMGDPRLGEPYLLPESEMEFDDALAKLNREGVRLLLHTGWQQPVYSRGNSQAYRLYSGHNFSDRYQADGRLSPAEYATESGTFDLSWLMPQAQSNQALWQLDGWIRIYLNQFLHIDTQLQLREEGERPVATVESEETKSLEKTTPITLATPLENPQEEAMEAEVETQPFLNRIRLEQSRRVRSRELHYFDHPKLGMVVQIRRMTQPSKMPPLQETPAEAPPTIEPATVTPASAQNSVLTQ